MESIKRFQNIGLAPMVEKPLVNPNGHYFKLYDEKQPR
jgi:hypothetical protein